MTKIAEQEFEITARRVLQELAALAFYKPSDYLAFGKRKITRKTKDGAEYEVEVDFVDMTPSEKLTETQMKAVVSAEMTTNKFGDTFPVIKLADRTKALVKLGEHLQLFNGKVEVNHTGTVQHNVATPPDLDRHADLREAVIEFEQFRRSLHAPGNA